MSYLLLLLGLFAVYFAKRGAIKLAYHTNAYGHYTPKRDGLGRFQISWAARFLYALIIGAMLAEFSQQTNLNIDWAGVVTVAGFLMVGIGMAIGKMVNRWADTAIVAGQISEGDTVRVADVFGRVEKIDNGEIYIRQRDNTVVQVPVERWLAENAIEYDPNTPVGVATTVPATALKEGESAETLAQHVTRTIQEDSLFVEDSVSVMVESPHGDAVILTARALISNVWDEVQAKSRLNELARQAVGSDRWGYTTNIAMSGA
ncbi:MAG: mechanosensitive ion channel domain-containing protein [Candidatus Promineifilaceae bacterium]